MPIGQSVTVVRSTRKIIKFPPFAGASTGGDYNVDYNSDFFIGTVGSVGSMIVTLVLTRPPRILSKLSQLQLSQKVSSSKGMIRSVIYTASSLLKMFRSKAFSTSQTIINSVSILKSVRKIIKFPPVGTGVSTGGDYNVDYNSDFFIGSAGSIGSITVVLTRNFARRSPTLVLQLSQRISSVKGISRRILYAMSSLSTAFRARAVSTSQVIGEYVLILRSIGKIIPFPLGSPNDFSSAFASDFSVSVFPKSVDVSVALARSIKATLRSPLIVSLRGFRSIRVLNSQVISSVRIISRLLSYAVSVLSTAARGLRRTFSFAVSETVTKKTAPVRSVFLFMPELITRRASMSKFVNVTSSSIVSLVRRMSHSVILAEGQIVLFFKRMASQFLFSISSVVSIAAANYNILALFVTPNLFSVNRYIGLHLVQSLQTGSQVVASAAKGLHALPLVISVVSNQLISSFAKIAMSVVIVNSESLMLIKRFAGARIFFVFSNPSILSIKNFVGKIAVSSVVQFISIFRSSYKVISITSSEFVKATRTIPVNVANILSSQYLNFISIRQVVSIFNVPLAATTGKITNKIIILYQRVTQPKNYDVILSYAISEVLTAKASIAKFVGQFIARTSSVVLVTLTRGKLFLVPSNQAVSISHVSSLFRALAFTISENFSVVRTSFSSVNFVNLESIVSTRAINRLSQFASAVSMILFGNKSVKLSQVLLQSSEALSAAKTYYRTPLVTIGTQLLVAGRSASRTINIAVNQIVSVGKIIARIVLDFSSEIFSTTTSTQFTAFQNLVTIGQNLSAVAKLPVAQFRFLLNQFQALKSIEKAAKLIQLTSVGLFSSTRKVFKLFSLSLSVISSIVKAPVKSYNLITNQVVTLTKLFYRLFSVQSVENIVFVKIGIKVFSYVTSEAVAITKSVVKYVILISNYSLVFTKSTNKLFFSFATRPVTSFSRVGSKYFVFTQGLLTSILKPINKVFSISIVEMITPRIRVSHILSFVSTQLDSLTAVTSKRLAVTVHSLLQFVRTSKGKIFVTIDNTLSVVKSVDWHLRFSSPEHLVLLKITRKIFGIQERVVDVLRLTVNKILRVSTTIPIQLTKITNKIFNVRLAEFVRLVKISHKIITISSREVVRKFVGWSVAFKQHTSLSLRHTASKIMRITNSAHLSFMAFLRKSHSVTTIRSTQLLVISRAVSKRIRVLISEKLRRVAAYHFTLRLFSLQHITKSLGFHKAMIVSLFEILFIRKSPLKSVRVKVASRFNVRRTTFKHIVFIIREKVQQGIIHHQAMSWVIHVTTTAFAHYSKIPVIVQGSVIYVFKKVRSLIQRAVILLTGA